MTKKTISTPSEYRQLLREHHARPDVLAADMAVERTPEVMRLRRRVLKMTDQMQARHPDQRAFVRYADERAYLEHVRTERYFDEGYARGQLAGAVASLRTSPAARALTRQVTEAVLAAKMPCPMVAATLLETARTLLLVSRGRKQP